MKKWKSVLVELKRDDTLEGLAEFCIDCRFYSAEGFEDPEISRNFLETIKKELNDNNIKAHPLNDDGSCSANYKKLAGKPLFSVGIRVQTLSPEAIFVKITSGLQQDAILSRSNTFCPSIVTWHIVTGMIAPKLDLDMVKEEFNFHLQEFLKSLID